MVLNMADIGVLAIREQTKVGFRVPERNQEVQNSPKRVPERNQERNQ